MRYIIASIEGIRHDLAPKYTGKYGKVYHTRDFDLLIWAGGDWQKEYQEAYDEIAAYVSRVNAEFKGNPYYKGWMYAEMLTPNEQGQYNDTRCHLFHSWLVEKILTGKVVTVTKVNVCDKDIHKKFDSVYDFEEMAKIARAVSGEMLKWIHQPGEYNFNNYIQYDKDELWDAELPIFELGWTLPYSIQLRSW